MPLEQQLELSLMIILSAILSMAIGMDRERSDRHTAGLRTHMMVAVGACLFTILSMYAFPSGDPGRVAAQVVTGVGFLGAGVIVERKRGAHNLTTAASVWVTAAIGMAVGSGNWLIGITATLVVWFILDIIRRYTKRDQKPPIEFNEDGEVEFHLMDPNIPDKKPE